MATSEQVRCAFTAECEELGVDVDFFTFDEGKDENVIVVKGREFLPDRFWKPLNEVVRRELGGEYSSVERGWLIPLEESKSRKVPTWTGLPGVDEKLEELEAEKVEGFKIISLKDITTAPVKIRQSIDEDYISELAETIRDIGVLQPIIVRSRPSGDYQIVVGEQRYRAAQKAGLDRLLCIIRDMGDREAFEASLIENLQRKDLTDYEVAKALDYMLKHFPDEYPHQKVLAFKLGKLESWVSEHLAVLDFESKIRPDELQKITASQASKLRAAPEEKREEIIREVAETGRIPSKREIEVKTKPTVGFEPTIPVKIPLKEEKAPRPWWSPVEKYVPINILDSIEEYHTNKAATKGRMLEFLRGLIEVAWGFVMRSGKALELLEEAEAKEGSDESMHS